MNWRIFELKYDKRETWAFEQMAYLLFCAEFNNRIGLFRYKNQKGIETEPFEKEGEIYGFQAKYYTVSLSTKKTELIGSVEKAKKDNPAISKIYFYLNKEFGEGKGQKQPKYQTEVESAAKELDVDIIWRVPSYFELQLSLPENKYIYDIFFNLSPNEGDLLDEVIQHNENILQAIQTEIPFGDKQIKIDRSHVVEEIANSCQKKKNIIISGEGGCGKTAIFKEFYTFYSKKIPICVFKATELNVNHINDLFRFDHTFSFAQFIDSFNDENSKIFVVDSAEKLAEIENSDILNILIQKLKEAGWNILFTTRYAYLNDLTFHIKENYQLSCDVNDIPLISTDELKSIVQEFNFTPPENQKFSERLRNLFYLSEYIHYYSNIDKNGNFRSFVDLLWKKRIQNNLVQKDNLHLEREKCIISIAKKRCETGQFYINLENLPQSALFQLKQDEILGYDEAHNGYFITHDIYEEWTLDKIVSRHYTNYSDIEQFFVELGNSLPMRRAFRIWLSEQLSYNSQDIESFIQDAFSNNTIIRFWKDEILVAVLLSDYSEIFFDCFEDAIVSDNFEILKRILFLLRIACTDISVCDNFDTIIPKGKGWETTIAFIHKYKSSFFENNLNLILPILTEWCDFTKSGPTTRYSGLLALSVIQKTETEKNFYMHDNEEESVLEIIFNSASEIKLELIEIFNKVIDNKWVKNNDPYEELCSKILIKPYLATELIKSLPVFVIKLCDLFWQKEYTESDMYGFSVERDKIERKYGLVDTYKYEYVPASAHQTPIYWLLKFEFNETLDFIIDFTNRAVEVYRQSDYGKEDVTDITLHMQNKDIKQYSSFSLWEMYRGNRGAPKLLKSIHMALEKQLLELAAFNLKPEIVPTILFLILVKSKSVSLTSIVCSIVLAHPNKFHNVALVLFKTLELFHMDLSRRISEDQVKLMYSIGYGLDKLKDTLYTDERIKTCEDKHRGFHLESLFLNYQLFGVKGFTDEQNTKLIEELYKIIDEYKSNLSTYATDVDGSLKILLLRMDRRNLTPKITKQDDDKQLIEFSLKELPDELEKQSEDANKQFKETVKYSFLRSWSAFLFGGNKQDANKEHEKYDNDPLLALSATKQLVEELKSANNSRSNSDYSIPGSACSKLMIQHKDKLSCEDKDFCKDIILANVCRIFDNDYDYQISDGVEASIHAIPSMITEYPDEAEDLLLIMILALLDERSIGMYKRICDYVIETIHESELWEENFKNAQTVLFGYIKFKPIYKNIIEEKRKEKGFWRNFPKKAILAELSDRTTDVTLKDLSFDIKDIDLFDIHDLEIIYLLIPSDTKDKTLLNIYTKTLPLLAPQLLKDRRSYEKDSGNTSDIYLLRINIFKSLTHFILQRETNEIDLFLKPLIDSFEVSEESSLFLEQVIRAVIDNNRYEQFWYVWNKFYSKIVEVSVNSNNHNVKKVITTYLLAWQHWNTGVEQWECLQKKNLSLYVNASKDLGHVPSVLYSIVKMLNSIGSNFKLEGVDWIYTIVSNNNLLQLGNLESDTLLCLDTFTRKFVFTHKQAIKREIQLKNKIIPILDFMMERGSIHGYLLRESIL